MAKDMDARITRLESRVVNGFLKLGVDPRTKETIGVTAIDHNAKEVYVADPSTRLSAIIENLHAVGAEPGEYTIHYAEETIDVDYTGVPISST